MNSESKDTIDEVLMVKEKVGSKKFYLVTAAYHMPRAMALFKKMGLNPIAAPTNFMSKRYKWSKVFNTLALHHNEGTMHEFIGLVWYKLRGFI